MALPGKVAGYESKKASARPVLGVTVLRGDIPRL
jgi:hypothetical protein